MASSILSSRSWFRLGPLGPLVAVPQTWEGWAALVGLVGPALVFASRGDEPGELLGIGLIAFLFGLAYAMAEEDRAARPARRASGGRDFPPTMIGVLSL
jgi:hypothetical protein